MNRRILPLAVTSALAIGLALTQARDADACGGCFHPPPMPNEVESVITDHRMVFSISTTQTVLWDQVRYSGDPKEFAWVLPIHPGARIELSHDAFIAALDASTRPVVSPPQFYCPGSGFSNGGGGGVGCGSSESDTSFAASGGGAEDAGSTPGVTVISQQTIGPYQAVTLRSTMGDKLDVWLTTNGYDVPSSIEPTLAAYATEGFDFIALKLRPGVGVRAMQPVRIVTEGADLSLPLRMIAAGVGANVGIELYVIGEGRYHTANFPDAVVDFTKLAWDPTTASSNFATLEDTALAANAGHGWITQSAQPAVVTPEYGSGGLNPGLYATYASTCVPAVSQPPVPCDSGAPSSDASSDADADDGGDAAAIDAGAPPDAAACAAPQAPDVCDDLDVALTGISGTPWVTRLRAHLPAEALAIGDLRLAAASQTQVENQHTSTAFTDPNYNPCGASSNAQPASSSGCSCNTKRDDERFGTWLLLGITALGTAGMLRRRRAR